jgi:hypothetical protein
VWVGAGGEGTLPGSFSLEEAKRALSLQAIVIRSNADPPTRRSGKLLH